MNDISVKIEQLLKLQKGVCEQYEKENKELLKTIKVKHALVILDIDNFKKFNDTYGHDQGDKIIKALEQS